MMKKLQINEVLMVFLLFFFYPIVWLLLCENNRSILNFAFYSLYIAPNCIDPLQNEILQVLQPKLD